MKTFKYIFFLLFLLICAFFIFGALTSTPLPLKQKAENLPIYISNISIVDVLKGDIKESHHVLILNGKIADISPDPITVNFPDFIQVDGENKYILPSLWDMHIHTINRSDVLHYPLYFANGILNVRDLGNTCSWSDGRTCSAPNKHWQRSVESKSLLGPNTWTQVSFHMEELEDSDIKSTLTWLKDRDDSVLKLQLNHDTTSQQFQSILNDAQKSDISVVGHLPANVDLAKIDLKNLNSIEHDRAFYSHCSEHQDVFEERVSVMVRFVNSYSEEKCRIVMQTIQEQGVAYTPTHIASSQQDINISHKLYEKGELNEYIDDTTLTLWSMYAWLTEKGFDEQDKQDLTVLNTTSLKLSRLAEDNGVLLLAGTDALDAFIYPGFSLYDELEMLSKAGLSNSEVIRTTTINPAKYFNVEASLGSVDIGKRADLVILNSNPLSDLSSLKEVDSVIFNGELYTNKELNEIKRYVASTAKDLSVTAKRFWELFFN
ncbi:hypothetical protein BET10_00175 [Pseudoalteromonas amylolytica]|uniref:Amidohydrolase-related domain-containing protein n=1 Tax=Pseudoalteromonas amylolytica TaxID=1859457 RepID=A0A1S1MK88_9GAMM|nr:amidohydrolase family protein [Pseudoalteromonas sp. JW3]OHU84390.1 hypothetical protein BFC16_01760 [Pseudoalteromonas sp. JW3]OHU87070.1 hypothetical protein BET10_00175 [Pseudoalteromonas amylolytica]